MLKANCRSLEMRKNNIVTYCVTFYLLSAVPENKGLELLESLSCFYPYNEKKINCTWSENNFSRNLVNMTLEERNTKNSCQNKSIIWSSTTHSNWTCHIPWGDWRSSETINFSFVPERTLRTRPNTEEEKDEAKPQNLHCNDTDGNITCSWRIRKEIAESIDFVLVYNNSEKKCPKCQQISDYLSCHCKIETDGHLNTSDIIKTISVEPKNNLKPFRLCLIYKLRPRNLTINEIKKGEIFNVHWKNTTEENESFIYNYELCYWNQNDWKLKEVPNNCPNPTTDIPANKDPSVILQLHTDLKPSSDYSVMVRVRLKEKITTHCYQGPWSEWSKVRTLTTKAVTSLILLYVLIPISIIVLVIFAVFGYKAMVRYTKQWDESIPNPNKSAIIKGLQKNKKPIVCNEQNGSCLPYEEHLYVEACNNIMSTSSVSKEPPYYYNNEEQISKINSQLSPQEDSKCFIFCDQPNEDYPTASIVDGYKPFTDLESEEESKDIKDSQFMFSAFDGPYMFSESNL